MPNEFVEIDRARQSDNPRQKWNQNSNAYLGKFGSSSDATWRNEIWFVDDPWLGLTQTERQRYAPWWNNIQWALWEGEP